MERNIFDEYIIDHIEIITPMARSLAYWHTSALGFKLTAYSVNSKESICSYVLESNDIRLVLTSSYPTGNSWVGNEISSFILQNYCGVRRIALRVRSVKESFAGCIYGGAFPVRMPEVIKDEDGSVELAAIRLYDHSEIVLLDRSNYQGVFLPGYEVKEWNNSAANQPLIAVDHIASEVRINEVGFWTRYLSESIGLSPVQQVRRSRENESGMIIDVNQSFDKMLTMVIAEPEDYRKRGKMQNSIETFGAGIHHLAFTTADMFLTIRSFRENNVEFVNMPPSYYKLLRQNPEFKGMDIDSLEANGISIDLEGGAYLLQKFIKPISERPFFLYEVVQRINGYSGFALKNINVLKKSEEMGS